MTCHHSCGNARCSVRSASSDVFGRKTVQEKCEVALSALGAVAAGFVIERVKLVGAYQASLKEQPADQGRFAMVDGAADDEPQQAFAFLARHEVVRIERRIV